MTLRAFCVPSALLVLALTTSPAPAQTTPPPKPQALNRFAWFGCDALTVNGNTKVYGVSSVGGEQGLGGHVGSNGNILVNGTNTIDGNATPGPGRSVTVTGNQTQVKGSKAPATALLPCQEGSVSDWAAYAQTANNNSAVPTTILNAQRNFTLNGSKSYALPAGVYYFNNVTVNGSAKLTVGGPATVVVTGSLTLNGNAALNAGGDPLNLLFIVASSSPVSLNSGARMSLQVYAPLSTIALNGNVTGTGNLWGKVFTGNGSVLWNRVKDGTPPSLALTQPADGSTLTTPRPEIALTYGEAAGGTGIDLTTFHVMLGDSDITGALTLSSSGASGMAPAALSEGLHTLSATLRDYEGNVAFAQCSFTVDLGGVDHDPPVVTVTGVAEGGLYGGSVTPAVDVSDPHLDPASLQITLNGLAYVSGTPVAAEGSYTLHVQADDTFGNHAESTLHFAVDLSAPVLTITGVAEGGVYGAQVTPAVSVTDDHLDAASVQMTLDGSPFASGTPVTTEGSHTLAVSAADTVGHTAQATATFTLDLAGPVITITGAENGAWYRFAVTPSVETTDPHLDPASIHITLNGQPFVSGTTLSDEGYFVIQATAADTLGHTAEASLAFAIDTTAPSIQVDSPPDHGITQSSPATLSGTVMDAHPETLTVNGEPAGSPGEASFTAPVALAEGSNTVHLEATDRAGNASSLDWNLTLKTTPPTVTLTSPQSGSVTNSNRVNVAGTLSQDAVSVSVNGYEASPFNGAFTAYQVPLQEGANTLVATAKDAAGNEASAQVAVTLDSQPPTIHISSPADGAHTNAGTTQIVGSVADASAVTATVNGADLPLNAGAFSAQASLVEGTNWISVRARDASGNMAESTLRVVRESGLLQVASITPARGETGVSTRAPIVVVFTRPVRKSTATADTFQVTSGGTALAGVFVGDGARLEFLPQAPYGQDASVSVALTAGIMDLAGNALTPFAATFTTAANPSPPLTLSLDAFTSPTKEMTLQLSGSTAPGATVTVTGGASPASASADSTGRFSVPVALQRDALNALSVQASVSGFATATVGSGALATVGPPVPFAVVQDSTPPSIVGFQAEAGGDLVVDFSEAITPESLSVTAVQLLVGGIQMPVEMDLEGYGTRLRIVSETPIGSSPAALVVTAEVADLAGNTLRESFRKTFNGGSTGEAFLMGEVFDDATGLPLAGATVGLIAGSGVPAGSTTSTALGGWALGVPARPISVHLSAAGYTDANREATPATGAILMVRDARLAPLSTETKVLGSAGGTAVFTGGAITVTAPQGALADDTHLRMTSLSGQSLPWPLPPGFSPLAAYRLDLEGESAEPSQPLAVSLTLATPPGTVLVALFDPETLAWIGSVPAAADGARATFAAPRAGTYVLLLPDAQPAAPPSVVEGQVIGGVIESELGTPQATLTTDPSVILPDQKARAEVTLAPAAPVSSGAPFQVTFTESLDLLGGGTRQYSPYTADLTAYQYTVGPDRLKANVSVSPFPGIDILTLLEGRIGLAVEPYAPAAQGGGILSGAGGTVDGAAGTHATLPPGATANAIPVRVFPVGASALLAPVPAGFAYLCGVELNLGGASLDAPALLSVDRGALSATVGADDLLLLVQASTVSGVPTYLCTDIAALDGTGTTARLRSLSGQTGALSIPAPLASLPWTGVRGEGRYIFLKATAPSGFTTGHVLDGASQPVPGAFAGRLTPSGFAASTSQRSNSAGSFRSRVEALVASGKALASALLLLDMGGVNVLADASGAYVVPVPAGPSDLRAVDLLTGDRGEAPVTLADPATPVVQDITLQVTPLAVLSTAPADGATGVPVGTEVYVTFSKLVAPGSLTAQTFAVSAETPGGTVPVPGGLRVLSGGTTVSFTPSQLLPGGSTVHLSLAGITDRSGRPLATSHTFSFTTTTPPMAQLDPGRIEAYLPDANGNVCVEGGPGAVEGGALLYLLNATHPEYGTVTVTANGNGSFGAAGGGPALCVRGAAGDRFELHVVPAAGGGLPERVYSFHRLMSADGMSVMMGPEGGSFTSKPGGIALATAVVPPGAFTSAVILTLRPGDPAQAAPVPEGFTASSPVRFEVTQPAQKEIALFLNLPAGSDPTRVYWLVQTVEVGGADPHKAPMVLDKLSGSACPDGPSGACLVTNSPPFPGLRASATLQAYEVQQPGGWGFFTGRLVLADETGDLVAACDATPFVFVIDGITGPVWTLPVPAAPAAGARANAQDYDIQFTDNATGTLVMQMTRTGAPDPGTIADLGITTNVATRPYLMASSPFASMPFQLKSMTLADDNNPSVGFKVEFASSANLRLQAPGGTTAPRDPAVEHPLESPAQRIEVSVGGATGYFAVQPGGEFSFDLTQLSPDVRGALSSGQTVTVTYPRPGGGAGTALVTVPEDPITEHLALRISQGDVALQAEEGFADEGATVILYDAMVGGIQYRLTPLPIALDVNLTALGSFRVGDVLFYTLSKSEVNAFLPLTVTFDRALSRAPAALPPDPGQEVDPGAPHVWLAVVSDPDPSASRLAPGTKVTILLDFAPGEGAPREIRVTPRAALKPGVTYDLCFENLSNDAGRVIPPGEKLIGRFTVYGGDVVGSQSYDDLFEIVRRGSILYVAAGDQGFDVLDASDPTNPLSLTGGPQGANRGRWRSLSVAQGVLISEDVTRTMIAGVGGGGAGRDGFIALMHADFPGEGTPPQVAAIGGDAGGARLCYALGSGQGGPQGTPTMVRTDGSTAYVATVGVGLQQVDLNKVSENAREAVTATVYRWVEGTEIKRLRDISGSIRSVGVLPAQGEGGSSHVVAGINGYGVMGWTGAAAAPQQAAREAFPAGVAPSGALRMAVYGGYGYTDRAGEPKTTNLMVMAGGSAGLLVYDLGSAAAGFGVTLKAVIALSGGAYDVAVDTRRHIAYVACYTSGVAMVDLSDPYFPAHGPEHPNWMLDANGDGIDDRLLGYVHQAPGSRTTLVVDSETGLLFIGEQGASSGMKAIGAQKPRMEFLLNKKDAGGNPIIPEAFDVPGFLDAFEGDKPRLGVWLPGGAGTTLQATLELYNKKGLPETAAVDSSDNPVVSTVYRTVALDRVSGKKTEAKYNFYIQRKDTVPDKVELAMLYDAAAPNANLMVTRQGGTLRAIANTPAWNKTTVTWGRNLRFDKIVSRPWVEWVRDELVEEEPDQGVRAKSGATAATGGGTALPEGFSGPILFAKDQPRDLTIRVIDEKHRFPDGTVITIHIDGTNLQQPEVPLPAPAQDKQKIKVRMKGVESHGADQEPDRISVTASNNGQGPGKTIAKMSAWVFDAGIAVDYNRDGEIHFTNDPSDTSTKRDSDKPVLDPQGDEKPFEFWVNNDFDDWGAPDDNPDPNAPNKAEQDDIEKRQDEYSTPEETIVIPRPDWTLEKPRVQRDLEDFARLHVRTVQRNVPQLNGLHYKLHFTKCRGGDPRLKVFKSARLQGDEEYLKNATAATNQLAVLPVNGATVSAVLDSIGLPDLGRAYDLSGLIPDSGQLVPLLFEAISEGQGELTLSVTDRSGIEMGEYKIPIYLKDIKQFYEQYTVIQNGDWNGGMPVSACPNIAGGSCSPAPGAFRYPLLTVPGTPPTDHDYVLYVHGWNMPRWERNRFAETIVKRMYWLGYKGRCGFFEWPSTIGGLGFDTGEYRGFQSGAGLKDVLLYLKETMGYRVHVLAHSQGNVPTGEALRQLGLMGKRDVVNTYIAAQAAVPSSLYTNAKPTFTLVPGGQDCLPPGSNCRNLPDLYGRFPENALPPTVYSPYFAKVRDACGRMVNFYNAYDNAVGTPVERTAINGLGNDNWKVSLAASVLNLISVSEAYQLLPCLAQDRYYGGWWRSNHCMKETKSTILGLRTVEFVRFALHPRTEEYYAHINPETGVMEGDIYYDHKLNRPLEIVPYPGPSSPFADDKYRAIAYGTQAYSAALGAIAEMDTQHGGPFDSEHNLQTAEYFNVPLESQAVLHIYHSGQFRSFLANTDHSRRSFWFQLLSDLNQSASTPRP